MCNVKTNKAVAGVTLSVGNTEVRLLPYVEHYRLTGRVALSINKQPNNIILHSVLEKLLTQALIYYWTLPFLYSPSRTALWVD